MIALATPTATSAIPRDPAAIYGRCASCAAVHRAPTHLRSAALGTQTRHLPSCIVSRAALASASGSAANRTPRRRRRSPRGAPCTRAGCGGWAVVLGAAGSETQAVCYYCHAQDLGAPRVRRGGAS